MTEIEQAIENVKALGLARIVEEFCGYIIMAQSEGDLRGKQNCISRGDTHGFYTVERALRIDLETLDIDW